MRDRRVVGDEHDPASRCPQSGDGIDRSGDRHAGQPHDAVEVTEHHVRPFHDGRRYPRGGRSVAGAASLYGCRGSNRSPPCATARPPSTTSSHRRTTCCRRPTVDALAARDEHNIVARRRARRRRRPLRAGGRDARRLDRRRHARRRRRADVHAVPHALRRRHRRRTRELVGVIGGLEVVDEGAGGVLPHERTTPKASTDRLDLTRATRSNLSPVWGLSLAGGLTDAARRSGRAGRHGHRRRRQHTRRAGHRPGPRSPAITALVGSSDVLIADGHHRYGIARMYRDEIRDATGSTRHAGRAHADVRRRAGGRAAERRGDPPPVRRRSRSSGCARSSTRSFDLAPIDEPTPATLAAMATRRVPGARRPGRRPSGWLTPARRRSRACAPSTARGSSTPSPGRPPR